MNALFIHGICSSNFFWIPTLIRFRAKGINPTVFGYSATLQDYSTIVRKLVKAIIKLSIKGEYVVVGHSLGGVLLRSAINELPVGTRLPKTAFLLGSPVQPSRIAKRLKKNIVYNAVTRDCGDLLSSKNRMESIPSFNIPTIAIIGKWGVKGKYTPFGSESNDCVVSLSEVDASWFSEIIQVPLAHNLLTSSKCVSDIILERVIEK
jgi:pimeloyl-ACP methyl ester carboxylesterase